jgi:hypothetical protein
MENTSILWLEIDFKVLKFNSSVIKLPLLANFYFIDREQERFLFGIFRL